MRSYRIEHLPVHQVQRHCLCTAEILQVIPGGGQVTPIRPAKTEWKNESETPPVLRG